MAKISSVLLPRRIRNAAAFTLALGAIPATSAFAEDTTPASANLAITQTRLLATLTDNAGQIAADNQRLLHANDSAKPSGPQVTTPNGQAIPSVPVSSSIVPGLNGKGGIWTIKPSAICAPDALPHFIYKSHGETLSNHSSGDGVTTKDGRWVIYCPIEPHSADQIRHALGGIPATFPLYHIIGTQSSYFRNALPEADAIRIMQDTRGVDAGVVIGTSGLPVAINVDLPKFDNANVLAVNNIVVSAEMRAQNTAFLERLDAQANEVTAKNGDSSADELSALYNHEVFTSPDGAHLASVVASNDPTPQSEIPASPATEASASAATPEAKPSTSAPVPAVPVHNEQVAANTAPAAAPKPSIDDEMYGLNTPGETVEGGEHPLSGTQVAANVAPDTATDSAAPLPAASDAVVGIYTDSTAVEGCAFEVVNYKSGKTDVYMVPVKDRKFDFSQTSTGQEMSDVRDPQGRDKPTILLALGNAHSGIGRNSRLYIGSAPAEVLAQAPNYLRPDNSSLASENMDAGEQTARDTHATDTATQPTDATPAPQPAGAAPTAASSVDLIKNQPIGSEWGLNNGQILVTYLGAPNDVVHLKIKGTDPKGPAIFAVAPHDGKPAEIRVTTTGNGQAYSGSPEQLKGAVNNILKTYYDAHSVTAIDWTKANFVADAPVKPDSTVTPPVSDQTGNQVKPDAGTEKPVAAPVKPPQAPGTTAHTDKGGQPTGTDTSAAAHHAQDADAAKAAEIAREQAATAEAARQQKADADKAAAELKARQAADAEKARIAAEAAHQQQVARNTGGNGTPGSPTTIGDFRQPKTPQGPSTPWLLYASIGAGLAGITTALVRGNRKSSTSLSDPDTHGNTLVGRGLDALNNFRVSFNGFKYMLRNNKEFRRNFIVQTSGAVAFGVVAVATITALFPLAAASLTGAALVGGAAGIAANYGGSIASNIRRAYNESGAEDYEIGPVIINGKVARVAKAIVIGFRDGMIEATSLRRIGKSFVAGALLGGTFHIIGGLFHGASAATPSHVGHGPIPGSHGAPGAQGPVGHGVGGHAAAPGAHGGAVGGHTTGTVSAHGGAGAQPAPAPATPTPASAPAAPAPADAMKSLLDTVNNSQGSFHSHFGKALQHASQHLSSGNAHEIGRGVAQLQDIVAQAHNLGMNVDAAHLNQAILNTMHHNTMQAGNVVVHLKARLVSTLTSNQSFLNARL